MVSFGALLETSDIISLHLPLSDETRHLLGKDAFERMKPTVYLVNTSRGPLVDQEALWSALQQGKLAGAALDVFEPEPPDLSAPLYRDERVIVTPHAAFYSAESVRELRVRAAHQITDALQGLRPENVVNPQVFTDRC
jgi:D-3-phosphoglycerate dehydrogenase